MNTTAPPDTTGGAHLTPPTLTGNDTFMLTPNVAQHPTTGDRQPIRHIERILEAAQVEDLRRRWPIRTDLLFKRTSTPTSAGHSLYEKQVAAGQHVDAIDLTVDFTGAKVLLFDDIFTTGSQLSAVSRKLREAGALRIDGLVIARVPWGG